MVKKCCVCGDKAEGLITYGEFVCWSCHEEATGEKPPVSHAHKCRNLHKRTSFAEILIAEHLANKQKERCER